MSNSATDAKLKKRRVIRSFKRLAQGFWTGDTRHIAWLMTFGIGALVIANITVNVGINRWNGFFFNALERKDTASVTYGIAIIIGLALLSASIAVVLVRVRMWLQVRWRQWLSAKLIARWLSERRFYQLTIVAGDDGSNPEFRIADDARLATEPLVDFLIGLTNALLTALAFISILWMIGGALHVEAFGLDLMIPGYMVLAAFLYSGMASLGMIILGRPLVAHVENKNAGEAQFRYELTRIRDSAENIALIGGDDDERHRLDETFLDLVKRWSRVIVQQARMTWISNSNAVLAPVVPLLLGAPKYLSGSLSLGDLMQIATAFVQVQVALNWLVENAIRIAEWAASAQRVVELDNALSDLDRTIGQHGSSDTILLGTSPDNQLRLQNLSIAQQGGKLMLEGADIAIAPGDKVLVKGESGTGKSTLIRAMAGLWPWGSGQILRPANASLSFMPQKPYMPLGTLKQALLYPDTGKEADSHRLKTVLKQCGLSHLSMRLEETDQWDKILSGGELQRLAFARILLNPPDIVIMDEATSALDEVSQGHMMEFLQNDLKSTTVIHVGHRPGLEDYHTREIHLLRGEGLAAVAQEKRSRGFRFFNRRGR